MTSENAKQSGRSFEVPNIWALRTGHNPYLHNVFALLGITPDDSERDFIRKCDRLAKRIRGGHDIVAHGHKMDETDIARAKHLTASELEYVAERLLTHTPHKVDINTFQEPMGAIKALTFEQPENLLPLPIRDLSFLTRLLPELADVAAGEPRPLGSERLAALARPDPAQEQIFDL